MRSNVEGHCSMNLHLQWKHGGKMLFWWAERLWAITFAACIFNLLASILHLLIII